MPLKGNVEPTSVHFISSPHIPQEKNQGGRRKMRTILLHPRTLFLRQKPLYRFHTWIHLQHCLSALPSPPTTADWSSSTHLPTTCIHIPEGIQPKQKSDHVTSLFKILHWVVQFSALNVRFKVRREFGLATELAIIGIEQEKEHQILTSAEWEGRARYTHTNWH